jgi:hypothetical protein
VRQRRSIAPIGRGEHSEPARKGGRCVTSDRALSAARRGRSSGRGLCWCVSRDEDRPARVEDVHELASAMPHVTVDYGTGDNPIYQVGRKSFIFFRNPRPDAVDPDTGKRYTDVIVFWVESEADKQALVRDETSPFFTTAHFDGHPSCCCAPAESVRRWVDASRPPAARDDYGHRLIAGTDLTEFARVPERRRGRRARPVLGRHPRPPSVSPTVHPRPGAGRPVPSELPVHWLRLRPELVLRVLAGALQPRQRGGRPVHPGQAGP